MRPIPAMTSALTYFDGMDKKPAGTGFPVSGSIRPAFSIDRDAPSGAAVSRSLELPHSGL